jgi:5-methylcytosine-specific restriction endonuclease McrA
MIREPLADERADALERSRLRPAGSSWDDAPSVDALRYMPYADYLRTAHWLGVRALALSRAGGICKHCHNDAPGLRLDVHHLTYERRGCETEEDVIVICRPCHAATHGLTA